MALDPGELQVLISRLTGVADEMGAVLRRAAFSPNIKERADCSAAAFTPDGTLLVQAEHIPVHLGSMPASVAAAIDALGASVAGRRPGGGQRPLRRRHPPQRHHRRGPGASTTRAPSSGGSPTGRTTPTSVAPRRVDPGRRHRDPAGGPAHPAGPAHPRGPCPRPRLVADARGALRRPRRAGRRQPGGRRSGCWRWPARRSTRSSRTASGACEPRSPRSPTDRGPSRTCSTRPGPRRRSRHRPRIRLTLTVDGEVARFDFTGTDPQRAGNVNAVDAVTRERGRLRPPVGGRCHHPRQRRRAAARGGRRAAGHRRGRHVPGRGGRRQRRGQPAGGRRVPRRARTSRPGPGAGRFAGHDEQPAHRRDRVGVLRDGRRRAGRTTRTGTA